MSVELFIRENAKTLGGNVYVTPNIPEKKLNNAVASIAKGVDPDYIIAILDYSMLGSCKEGCVFLGDRVYMRSLGTETIVPYKEIQKSEYVETPYIDKKGNERTRKEATITFLSGKIIDCTSYMYDTAYESFTTLIDGIVSEGGTEKEYTVTAQSQPLATMDIGVKKAYVKILCNYALSDDNIIDAEEYAAILSLMVRIGVDTTARFELRSYMCSEGYKERDVSLLSYLEENVPSGSLDIYKKSIFKDVLYLFKSKNSNGIWRDNDYILMLQKQLNMNDEQIEMILAALKNDEEILKQRKNDSEIAKSMKDIAAKAGAVGIPMAAIYFSGSVIGVSAAGLTSGLATLGMGGLLGFSSMFTGIGVAVLIGVGTYTGFKKVTGISDLENNKQREIMLQAIVRNSNKALSYLIEDVNEISTQLSIEILKGATAEVQVKKLADILSTMSKGAGATTRKIQYAESETVIAKLPRKLDVSRLNELTAGATKEKLRGFVLSCYESVDEVSDDGTVRNSLLLNDKLALEILEQLHEVIDSIGYNNVTEAAVASAKGAIKGFAKSLMGD